LRKINAAATATLYVNPTRNLCTATRRREPDMKIRLRIQRGGSSLFEGTYEVTDSDSFGRACADAWEQIRTRRLEQATSVGALIDMLNQNVLDELQGAEITLSRA
jgi:hypothetical protein